MSLPSSPSLKNVNRLRIALIVVVLLVLSVLAYQSWKIFRRYARNGNLAPRYPFHRFLNPHEDFQHLLPITPPTADTLKPWMTFDYLNRTLHLPSVYLQSTLSIQNSSYPNLSIKRYALTSHLNTDEALLRVQSAVRAYTSSSTKQLP